MLHLAVDVGGTFTDICVFDDESGSTRVGKVSSTRDPIDAVFEGVEEVGVALDEIGLFSHGTTVATNALITRSFPRAAMITTKGFKDVIEIRRGTKQDLWDAYKDVAPPYIRRRDRFEVAERVDYAGKELEPVDEDEVRHLAHLIRRRGIETVAVCLVNAHVNPEHETRVKEILEEELPDVAVSTSSEVLPEIFEHERFSTTVKRYPARRWVVERTLGWLSKCRAILVRYDKKAANYLGLIKVACILLWYRRQHRLSLLRLYVR